MRDVRYREDTGFEGKCEICAEWLPVTTEFWNKRWLTRCKVCIRSYKAENQRKYMDDEIRRLIKNEKRRIYRKITPSARAYEREYRRAHLDEHAAYMRAWREANKERVREVWRTYYHKNREVMLERQRRQRAARKLVEKAA